MPVHNDVNMAPAGLALSPEIIAQIAEQISNQTPNKRGRGASGQGHNNGKVLLEHSSWHACPPDARDHMYALKASFHKNGMKIPYDFLATPTARDDASEIVQASMEYLPPGMHGRIDPCMMALKTAFTESLQYAQLARTIRTDNVRFVDKLMNELRALDMRGELPAGAKQLLPDAQASFTEMEQVMQSDDYISKIKFSTVPPPEAD